MPQTPAVRVRLRSGAAPVLIAAMLWGTTGTASTFAPAGAPPAAIGSAGLALGGLLLFVASRRGPSPVAAFIYSERWLLAVGAPTVAGYPLTFYPAVAKVGVAVATVIALGSAPVFAGLLGWLTGQGRPSPRWAGATLAAVAGCTLLVAGVLAALAGLSYAAYSLIGGMLITRGHASSRGMGAMFGGGSLVVLPVLLAGDTHWLATVRGAAVALDRRSSPRSSPTGSSAGACAASVPRWRPP